MALSASLSWISLSRTAASVYIAARSLCAVSIAVIVLARAPAREDAYNVLWAVVFGFATLNILSLAGRRFDPGRRGLSFGELLAVLVVFISVLLLGSEMLTLFHIFPIKLHR